MKDYFITGGDIRMRSAYPPEILLKDDIIENDNMINAVIPQHLRIPGTIVYNADYSIIKHMSLEGEWIVIKQGG